MLFIIIFLFVIKKFFDFIFCFEFFFTLCLDVGVFQMYFSLLWGINFGFKKGKFQQLFSHYLILLWISD